MAPQIVKIKPDELLRPVASDKSIDFDLLKDGLKKELASYLLGLKVFKLGNCQADLATLLDVNELSNSLFLCHAQLEIIDQLQQILD